MVKGKASRPPQVEGTAREAIKRMVQERGLSLQGVKRLLEEGPHGRR